MTLEELNNRRKRLIFRSWHRGTREMDLIMGTFADANVMGMDDATLDVYEDLLDTPDPDLYDWYSGQKPADENARSPVLDKFLSHKIESER